jgi:hypothetical protein
VSKLEKDLFGAASLFSKLVGGEDGDEMAEVIQEVAKKHLGDAPAEVPKGGFPGPPAQKAKQEDKPADDGVVDLSHCNVCDAFYDPRTPHGCAASPHKAGKRVRGQATPHVARDDEAEFFCSHCGKKNKVTR